MTGHSISSSPLDMGKASKALNILLKNRVSGYQMIAITIPTVIMDNSFCEHPENVLRL